MGNSLISENLGESLLGQFSHERFNANVYLFLAGFFKNKGLDKIADKFEKQYEEELGHSKIIYSLLTDLNFPFIVPALEGFDTEIKSILDVSKLYLDREILTTSSLADLRDLAIEENNPVVEERIRQMILLQQNEYEEATTFADACELLGDDWKSVLLWNNTL